MNITQAKKIPLSVIIEQLGGRYSHAGRNGETWYISCFRPDEQTASLKVNELTNEWYDFGPEGHISGFGSGGDTLDLWCDYHNIPRDTETGRVLAALAPFERMQQFKENGTMVMKAVLKL